MAPCSRTRCQQNRTTCVLPGNLQGPLLRTFDEFGDWGGDNLVQRVGENVEVLGHVEYGKGSSQAARNALYVRPSVPFHVDGWTARFWKRIRAVWRWSPCPRRSWRRPKPKSAEGHESALRAIRPCCGYGAIGARNCRCVASAVARETGTGTRRCSAGWRR